VQANEQVCFVIFGENSWTTNIMKLGHRSNNTFHCSRGNWGQCLPSEFSPFLIIKVWHFLDGENGHPAIKLATTFTSRHS
jgi:hypothetical protein